MDVYITCCESRNVDELTCGSKSLAISRVCSSGWTRTSDPAVNSRLLYRLSYAGIAGPKTYPWAARCQGRAAIWRRIDLDVQTSRRLTSLGTMSQSTAVQRCAWAGSDPLYVRYHDEEWGIPSHDDRHLFEMLILEGAQAGLSWITILRKREGYRRAFDRFDARKIARYDSSKVKKLLADESIVRNRLKIAAATANARAFLAIQKDFGSFDQFAWSFVGGEPIVNHPRTLADIPPRTSQSDALSRELKKRGFRFVGSTICYAFMQACGLVNDHVVDCHLAPARQEC